MHNWPTALQRQFLTLLHQLEEGHAYIGVSSIKYLVGERYGPRRLGGRIEVLASQPFSRAFVWMQGAEPELWVDPRDPGYRDLFHTFAKERLGIDRPTGTEWNIDHLFPKAAGALDGMSHVRAMAIRAHGNQSLGRTVEKAMKHRAAEVPSKKNIRSATWMTIGKVAGYAGWHNLPDSEAAGNTEAVADLFAYLETLGIKPPAGALELELTAHTLSRIR